MGVELFREASLVKEMVKDLLMDLNNVLEESEYSIH
jgi:hypothetical protein